MKTETRLIKGQFALHFGLNLFRTLTSRFKKDVHINIQNPTERFQPCSIYSSLNFLKCETCDDIYS